MDYLPIQGTPILINAFYVQKDSPPPPSPHPLTGVLLTTVEFLLPRSASAVLKAAVAVLQGQVMAYRPLPMRCAS